MTYAELKAHNFAGMALHALDEVKIRIHKCDICGKTEPWSESWSYYGSLASEEFGHTLKFCSKKCAKGVDTGGSRRV